MVCTRENTAPFISLVFRCGNHCMIMMMQPDLKNPFIHRVNFRKPSIISMTIVRDPIACILRMAGRGWKEITLPMKSMVIGMYTIRRERKRKLYFIITEISMKLSLSKTIFLLGIGISIHGAGGNLQAGSLLEIN